MRLLQNQTVKKLGFTFWLEIVWRHTCKFSSSNRESNSWIWREVAAADGRDWATSGLKPCTPSFSQVPLQILLCLLKKDHFLSQESSIAANREKSGEWSVRATHLQHQAPGVSVIPACSPLFLLMGIWCLLLPSPPYRHLTSTSPPLVKCFSESTSVN